MKYYVNDKAQKNGDHEVHTQNCPHLPDTRTYLGDFASCKPAVEIAKKIYPKSNGCYHCSKECHTG